MPRGRTRKWPATFSVVVALLVGGASCGGSSTAAPSTTQRTAAESSTTSASIERPTPTTTDSPTTEPPSTEPTIEPPTTPSPPPGPVVRRGIDVLVDDGFDALAGRRVGLVTNPVSTVDGRHLIDLLVEAPEVDLVRVFAAEHGVRGTLDAGAAVDDEVDPTTGIEIASLYGERRQPTAAQLDDLDVVVVDLQDVGTRFYTYTATMGLVMQAAAAADVAVVVLDRPNPLGGDLVEGYLRDDDQVSFISAYPVPAVHGLTAGELARMIVGERWLDGLDDLDLRIIGIDGDRSLQWRATGLGWIPPSPGLQTAEAAATYPTTVLFEATTLGYGAGTELAFRAVGAPWLDADAVVAELSDRDLPGVTFRTYALAPRVIPGIAGAPRFEGESFDAIEVVVVDPAAFRPWATGVHLLDAVIAMAPPDRIVIDRPAVLDLLAGTDRLRRRLLAGDGAAAVVAEASTEAAEFRTRSLPYRN